MYVNFPPKRPTKASYHFLRHFTPKTLRNVIKRILRTIEMKNTKAVQFTKLQIYTKLKKLANLLVTKLQVSNV